MKLAAELLIDEDREADRVRSVVNRCGGVAGPWQMGKVDQGVFTYWMLAHHFRRDLRDIGFGGTGKQVRDLLHVEDLVDLVEGQLCQADHWNGVVANVGGGRECSLSLRETTELCSQITGRALDVMADKTDRPGDVSIYSSDTRRGFAHTD